MASSNIILLYVLVLHMVAYNCKPIEEKDAVTSLMKRQATYKGAGLQCPQCDCVDQSGTVICCSCPSTAASSGGSGVHCFPSTARVSLENGNSITMAELQVEDRYADDIAIGDEVLVYKNNEIIPSKVDNVSSFMVQGAYVPLTMEGNIIVDGVLASCYASSHHELVHIATLPIQWFPGAIDWIFCDDNKFLAYVNILNDLGHLVLSNDLLYV